MDKYKAKQKHKAKDTQFFRSTRGKIWRDRVKNGSFTEEGGIQNLLTESEQK